MISVEVSVAIVASLFTLVLVQAYGLGITPQVGMKTILGNREAMPEASGWVGRAQRAHQNALENLVPFAIVAFALQISGLSSGLSQVAALVFLAARVIHGLSYILGIQGLRTLAWNVGFFATVAAAIPLFSALKF